MKRTTELFFSIVGVVLFGLLALGSGILWLATLNGSGTADLVREFLTDENITEVSAGQVVDFLTYGTVYMFVISLVCTIIGIVAFTFLKGNKKPHAAGKLLTLTAILGTVATVFMGIIAGISYLAAGILALSRKESANHAL